MNDLVTNALLGYPADARLMIINADDFGMCHAINEAVFQAMQTGVASSTSLMTPCPWAPHAMSWLKENSDTPFGVHLTITSNPRNYRWGPMTSRSKVPSLVDEAGYFYSDTRIPELLARAKLDEVEMEFHTQIKTVLDVGLAPTHLDWHCLADGGRPDIFDITYELAREFGLALRIHDRAIANKLQRAGLPTNDYDLLDSYRLDTVTKATRYAQLLRELPAGLTEWAVHPGLGNAELQTMESVTWKVRETDYAFLTSQAAHDILREEEIILIDYRALQKRWSP